MCKYVYVYLFDAIHIDSIVRLMQRDEVASGTAWSQLGRAVRLESSWRPGARCAHNVAKLKPRKPGGPRTQRVSSQRVGSERASNEL